jgi:hypothetical protein
MEKNTKILIGLGVAAAGVVAYLVFKPKNNNATPAELDYSKPPNSITLSNLKFVESGNEADEYDYYGYVVYASKDETNKVIGYTIPINGVNWMYYPSGYPMIGT